MLALQILEYVMRRPRVSLLLTFTITSITFSTLLIANPFAWLLARHWWLLAGH